MTVIMTDISHYGGHDTSRVGSHDTSTDACRYISPEGYHDIRQDGCHDISHSESHERNYSLRWYLLYLPLSLIIYNIYINRLLLPNSERTPYLLHLLERLPLPNSTRTPYLSIQRRDSPLVELKMVSGPL